MANSDISGQITDSSGNPIASAKVYLWREDLAGAGGVVTSTTADSSGNFAFTAHPDGSGSSESWHVAAEDPNANVQLKSTYGVTASPPTSVNSQFDVSITDTSPSPVAPSQTLAVDASLTNNGTDSDTQTITLDIDNGVGQVDSSLEAAQGGASKSTTLSWSVPSGQTDQDYTASVSSADDSATEIVTVSSEVVFGFETGDTSRWDTAPNLSVVSASTPFNSGSFIGGTNADGASTAATVVPSVVSGGAQISKFEFYWKEQQTSYGGGARLRNSNGNIELSTVSNNPQWQVQDANGTTQVNDGNSDYNDWTRFTVTFNWSAGTFDIDFKNLESGLQETQSGFALRHGVDIEELKLTNFNNGDFSGGGGNFRMQWDDVTFKL